MDGGVTCEPYVAMKKGRVGDWSLFGGHGTERVGPQFCVAKVESLSVIRDDGPRERRAGAQ